MVKTCIDQKNCFINAKIDAMRQFDYEVDLKDEETLKKEMIFDMITMDIDKIFTRHANRKLPYVKVRYADFSSLKLYIVGKRYIHNDAMYFLQNNMEPRDQVAYAYDSIFVDENSKNKTGNFFICDAYFIGKIRGKDVCVSFAEIADEPMIEYYITQFVREVRMDQNVKIFKIVEDERSTIGNVVGFKCIRFDKTVK